MAVLQERVAHVEGQVTELSLRISAVEGAIHHLERRMDSRFEAVDRRFDALDGKMSRQFMWLVGLHVTTLVAIVTTLAAIVIAVLPAR
jgi:hypothetical protein